MRFMASCQQQAEVRETMSVKKKSVYHRIQQRKDHIAEWTGDHWRNVGEKRPGEAVEPHPSGREEAEQTAD